MISKGQIPVVGIYRRVLILVHKDQSRRNVMRPIERELVRVVDEFPGISIKDAVSNIDWDATWSSFGSAVKSVDYLIRSGAVPIVAETVKTRHGRKLKLFSSRSA